ncbi:hypothetical protein HC256_009134 [Beauveria bassiana]|nr:hypothetical protein HC256_009134 [Beauveria bassiana]
MFILKRAFVLALTAATLVASEAPEHGHDHDPILKRGLPGPVGSDRIPETIVLGDHTWTRQQIADAIGDSRNGPKHFMNRGVEQKGGKWVVKSQLFESAGKDLEEYDLTKTRNRGKYRAITTKKKIFIGITEHVEQNNVRAFYDVREQVRSGVYLNGGTIEERVTANNGLHFSRKDIVAAMESKQKVKVPKKNGQWRSKISPLGGSKEGNFNVVYKNNKFLYLEDASKAEGDAARKIFSAPKITNSNGGNNDGAGPSCQGDADCIPGEELEESKWPKDNDEEAKPPTSGGTDEPPSEPKVPEEEAKPPTSGGTDEPPSEPKVSEEEAKPPTSGGTDEPPSEPKVPEEEAKPPISETGTDELSKPKISAEEASVKMLPGSGRSGVFYRGDSKPPDEVFSTGFKPQGNPLVSKGRPEVVSLFRSETAAKSQLALSADGEDAAYMYVLAPEGVPDGHLLSEIDTSSEYESSQEFIVDEAVPGSSVSHAYEVRASDPSFRSNKIMNENYLLKQLNRCTIMKRATCDPAKFDVDRPTAEKPVQAEPADEPFTESELVETYEGFAEAEFTRMASAYGISGTLQRSQTPGGPSAFSRIWAKFKGYSQLKPEAIKLKIKGLSSKLGGPAAFAAVGLVPWAVEMQDVFTHQSTNWEQLAVATSIIPVLGCVTAIGAKGEDGKGFDGDDAFCLATNAVLLTPAWPVALAVTLIKMVIDWIPNALEAKREFASLRDEGILQQRRVDEWNKQQPRVYDNLKISLQRDEFLRYTRIQLQSETTALVFSGAQVAGGLHTGALISATDAKQREEVKANNRYPIALSLNIQICDQFTTRKSRLRDDLINKAHQTMRDEQASFDDHFFSKVKDFLKKNKPSPQGRLMLNVVTDKQLTDYADGVRSKHSLPPPLSDVQIARVEKIIDEALAWEPQPCNNFCRQDDDLDCQWANCGPEPPTDPQVESNGLLHLFNDSAYLVDQSMSESCQKSYGNHCYQTIMIAQKRGYPVQPSKLLCKSKSKPADIDPTTLANTSSFLAVEDYNSFISLFPDLSKPCGRAEMCDIEPSASADVILAKDIPGDETVRKQAFGLVSEDQQSLFQDRPPQGWETCYSSEGLKEREYISSNARAISDALGNIQQGMTQGTCKACNGGRDGWVLGCGLDTAEWREMVESPAIAQISAPIAFDSNMMRIFALQDGELVERVSGQISSGSTPSPPYRLSKEPFVGSPSVVSLGDADRAIRVYARNEAGELLEALWTRTRVGWTGWEKLGGTIASDPFAVSTGENKMRVYARNQAGALVERSYSEEAGWSTTWAALDGLNTEPFVGSPSAIWLGDADSGIRVYARNEAGELLEASWTQARSWTGWENLGGSISSDPFAIFMGQGKYRVYARDEAGSLVERSYGTEGTGTGWSAWATPEGLDAKPFVGSPTATWRGDDVIPGGLGIGIRVYARNQKGNLLVASSADGQKWWGWHDTGSFEQ